MLGVGLLPLPRLGDPQKVQDKIKGCFEVKLYHMHYCSSAVACALMFFETKNDPQRGQKRRRRVTASKKPLVASIADKEMVSVIIEGQQSPYRNGRWVLSLKDDSSHSSSNSDEDSTSSTSSSVSDSPFFTPHGEKSNINQLYFEV